MGGGQRLVAAPELGEPDAEVVQAHREVGEEGVGARQRKAPADGRRPPAGGQRLSRRPRLAEPDAEVGQAGGEVGEEGVGAGRGEAPVDVDRLLRGGQRLVATAQPAQVDAKQAGGPGKIGQLRARYRSGGRAQVVAELNITTTRNSRRLTVVFGSRGSSGRRVRSGSAVTVIASVRPIGPPVSIATRTGLGGQAVNAAGQGGPEVAACPRARAGRGG